MFVTFEGLEGAGKSTVIDGVAQALAHAGIDVVPTREPGGTRVGDALRALFLDPQMQLDPMTEALVVNASRAQLVAEVIRPALRAGKTCSATASSTRRSPTRASAAGSNWRASSNCV